MGPVTALYPSLQRLLVGVLGRLVLAGLLVNHADLVPGAGDRPGLSDLLERLARFVPGAESGVISLLQHADCSELSLAYSYVSKVVSRFIELNRFLISSCRLIEPTDGPETICSLRDRCRRHLCGSSIAGFAEPLEVFPSFGEGTQCRLGGTALSPRRVPASSAPTPGRRTPPHTPPPRPPPPAGAPPGPPAPPPRSGQPRVSDPPAPTQRESVHASTPCAMTASCPPPWKTPSRGNRRRVASGSRRNDSSTQA